uniref:Fungal lipase-type domain-containing protein n=1 Tax=Mucochytrium quahogii TaxID=96639 RepID=A0A7S2WK96_9STRA|mmetsp:Transcript_9241/g.15005  ORF Transcript_9241/g.15005 Transcript_9241/m.15005 type:complete len:336 (+) Transcript_9241:219-1226(+)|eukprot:CAMPEP_0203782288 /NCGR_PEP_ID=MMETSP0099_2-20121227/10902_1 /ASSEMBLY_ACC=CAM_ASM_000209 /TAXON_ID=96639 /ORGANISM=" , Strain NY0313808BC1" /LENGTH=335 /DNA_ID=CAMNT_0050683757 /DNA_START=193 /DNA_END=1200 /DNA_ORIENTATION=+
MLLLSFVALCLLATCREGLGAWDQVPLDADTRELYEEYVELLQWLWVDTPTPTLKYKVLAHDQRWALLEKMDSSNRYVLIHRGTKSGDDAIKDANSQFAKPENFFDISVNNAFLRSYREFNEGQMQALKDHVSPGGSLDIAGHSLGGATAQMALMEVSQLYNVRDLVLFATPRALFRGETAQPGQNCSAFKKLASRRVVRFNRGTTGYTDSMTYHKSGSYDVIGAVPMSRGENASEIYWIQCANIHVKIASTQMKGGFTGLELVDDAFPWPFRNVVPDFALWMTGPYMEWHLPDLYAAGLNASIPNSQPSGGESEGGKTASALFLPVALLLLINH